MRLLSMQDRSVLSRWWWNIDRPLLGAILAVAVLGAGLVTTASPAVANRLHYEPLYFVIRHMMFLTLALGAMVMASLMSAKQIWRFATVIGVLSLVGVVITLFAGVEIKGATRWVHLPGFSIQPSEFVKPCFVIMAGWLLARQKTLENFPGFWLALALFGITALLLISQPDFGMTVVVTATFFAMVFLAGCPLRFVAVMIGLAVSGAACAYFLFDHVRSRVDRFLDPSSGDTYQVDRSLEAFANGGLLGTGPGGGQVKLQLPDAHADFIFSVAAEELGLIFTLLVVALYGFIVLRGFMKLRGGNSVFSMLAGGGLLIMLGLQALIHMGSATQLLPAKGMTLPFISYGGSSLLAVGMTMGFI
ncbi:MAG TPA: putative peptidoglycan glycosyltransferase FtsW, partial [Alphaproteobacteria bacterium]